MINKRGKFIALGSGVFFLLLIVMQSMGDDSSDKESFYNNFSTADRELNISKEKKKKASLQTEELNTDAESYQIEHNKKDKGFSLYRDLLSDDHEVEETIVEKSDLEEEDNESVESVQTKRAAPPKIVYVTRQEPEPNKTQDEEKDGKKRRRISSSKGSSSSNDTRTIEQYFKAEIFQSTVLDVDYPSPIEIRVLEEIKLPDGRVIEKNTLLRGLPKDSRTFLTIEVPEYNLEVYSSHDVKGILLTEDEGLSKEVDELSQTSPSATVSVPVLGSVNISGGKKRHERKIRLYQNQSIFLKWEE